MEQVKKLVLDYSKWHSGGDTPSENSVGKGKVALLNNEGYMCCLGQWLHQLGAPLEMLKNNGEPYEVKCVYAPFSKADEDDEDEGIFTTNNTELSGECMGINDDPETTPEMKILLLSEELKKHKIELEVINLPNH